MVEIQSRSFHSSVDVNLEENFESSLVGINARLNSVHEVDARGGVFGRLLVLARQRTSWSPTLIACELWQLFVNINARHEILRLLKLRPFDEIARKNPRLALKYVVPGYLARSLKVTQRVSCFLHHYRRIYAALPEGFLRQMLEAEVSLHHFSNDFSSFSFTLGSPEPCFDQEGELALNLQVNGKKVFNLSFTIVPGWVLNLGAPEALLISRLQGRPGCNSEIRLARRAFNDYSPRSLLLAALQGIADALGVHQIAAVTAGNQKSYIKGNPAAFQNGYDGFFTRAGMMRTSCGFYSSSVPIEGKALALFKGRARSRANQRRAVRQQIRFACANCLSEMVRFTGHLLSDTDLGASAAITIGSGPTSFSTSNCDRHL